MSLSVYLPIWGILSLEKNKINLFWEKNAVFFQWIKINTNKVTMSDYMNPNTGKQELYLVSCRKRINPVKGFAMSIIYMLTFS